MMKLYVLTMKHWGSNGTHNYVKGVYSSESDANFAGKVEESWRGYKYSAQVTEVTLDAPTPEEELHHYFNNQPGDVNCE